MTNEKTPPSDVLCDTCGHGSTAEPGTRCTETAIPALSEPDTVLRCSGHYRDRCEPEIRQSLVISTAHLTRDDAERLELGDFGTALGGCRLDYGYQLWVGNGPEDWEQTPTTLREDGWTTDFYRIAQLAWERGCSFIVFDCDGPPTHLLPRHLW